MVPLVAVAAGGRVCETEQGRSVSARSFRELTLLWDTGMAPFRQEIHIE